LGRGGFVFGGASILYRFKMEPIEDLLTTWKQSA
jgi:hypothetical protein